VSWPQVADVIAAVFLLLGAMMSMLAAIGLLRLPDLLSRMHAASKPQSLGLVLVLIGLAFRLREPEVLGLLVLIAASQLLTTPVANHMLGRASVRAGQVDETRLIANDLDEAGRQHQEPRGAP
jgi:multicomponent Na+:H+ antiporter subunit G